MDFNSHYKKFKIEPKDYIKSNNYGFELGNIVKYIVRDKGEDKKDLKKILDYIDYELEMPIPPISSDDFCKENNLNPDQVAVIKGLEIYHDTNSRDALLLVKEFVEKLIKE